MAPLGVLMVCCVLLPSVAYAYMPDHVKRQLLNPEHGAVLKFSQQHVAYSDPDYKTQQHMHVQLWSLNAINGLQDVLLHHGELAATSRYPLPSAVSARAKQCKPVYENIQGNKHKDCRHERSLVQSPCI